MSTPAHGAEMVAECGESPRRSSPHQGQKFGPSARGFWHFGQGKVWLTAGRARGNVASSNGSPVVREKKNLAPRQTRRSTYLKQPRTHPSSLDSASFDSASFDSAQDERDRSG